MPATRPHAVAWLVWALAAAASIELAPNPVYVAVVIAAAFLVVSVHSEEGGLAQAFPILLGVGIAFGVLRVVLMALTTHSGIDVLFTVPHVDLPRLLGGFRLGGTVELPVVLQAASESFAVIGLMAVFGAFNAVVSHHQLVQAAPRAFYEPGLVVTVAVAFVPSTIGTIQRVREADRARTGGQVVRRGRLVRLTVPVLESALERAMALAESMDARGFAHEGAGPAERQAGWCVLGGLLGLAGGFAALVGRQGVLALTLGMAGTAALVAAVALASRASPRLRYRPRRMQPGDWRLGALALVAPGALAALALLGDDTLRWQVSPFDPPGVNGLALGALLGLAWPATWAATRT